MSSLLLPLAVVGQLIATPVLAQGPPPGVHILHLSGPQLGVRLLEVDKDAAARLKLGEEKGALVAEVLKDTPAEKAGIKEDDVIVAFQGLSVLTAAQLSRLIKDSPAGRKAEIDLLRAGAPVKVTVTLESREWSGPNIEMKGMPDWSQRLDERMRERGDIRFESSEAMRPFHEGDHAFAFRRDPNGPTRIMMPRPGHGRLGVTYNEIGDQLAKYFKAPGETAILVESVAPGSPAEKAGIKAGDLLTKVDGVAVRNGSDLQTAVGNLEAGKSAPLSVWRDGRIVELTVTLSEDENKAPERRRRPVS